MEQQSFQSMVDKYKEDMLRMARTGEAWNQGATEGLLHQTQKKNESEQTESWQRAAENYSLKKPEIPENKKEKGEEAEEKEQMQMTLKESAEEYLEETAKEAMPRTPAQKLSPDKRQMPSAVMQPEPLPPFYRAPVRPGVMPPIYRQPMDSEPMMPPIYRQPIASEYVPPIYRQPIEPDSMSPMDRPPVGQFLPPEEIVPRDEGQLTDPNRESASMLEESPEALNEVPEKPMTYQEFLRRNSKVGRLKIEASYGQGAIPIEGVKITVRKRFLDGVRTFYTLRTNSSGMIEGILLPAPDKEFSEEPSDIQPYALYEIIAELSGFEKEVFQETPIFDGITSIQKIRMLPSGAGEAQGR